MILIRGAIALSLLSAASCRAHKEDVVVADKRPESPSDYLPFRVTGLGNLNLAPVMNGSATVTLEESAAEYRVIVEFSSGDGPGTLHRLRQELLCRLLTEEGKSMDPGEGLRREELHALSGETADRAWIPFSFRRPPELRRISAVVVSVGGTRTKFPLVR